MQKYTKNYIASLDKCPFDYFGCEDDHCGGSVVDIHHVTPRSLGGSDQPENLIGFCRHHHESSEPGRDARDKLNQIVRQRMGDRYREGFDLKKNVA